MSRARDSNQVRGGLTEAIQLCERLRSVVTVDGLQVRRPHLSKDVR